VLGDVLTKLDLGPACRLLEIDNEWQRELSLRQKAGKADFAHVLEGVGSVGALGDSEILEILARYRDRGFHVYLLPPPPDLPFGRMREDILIIRR